MGNHARKETEKMATHKTNGMNAGELATLETLEAARQNTAVQAGETANAARDRIAAADESLRAHVNAVGQRNAKRLNADGSAMNPSPVFIP
jgi:hypothetical protein